MLENPKQFLKSLPNKPGVYQMYGVSRKVLYVGKAKNLKARLGNYFRSVTDSKILALMLQVKTIEIIITVNENEALLLESNLIKTLKPRYNVLFKDDKSFPYLILSQHEFPRLSIYRGDINRISGKYFGPFPSTKAVNFVFNLLQKIFCLRVCKDSFLCNRSRPCMLYQIKLCTAPCVGYVNKIAYASQVKLVEQFLSNKSDDIVQKFTELMDTASAKLAYEQAAYYRDQIASVRKIQSQQAMTRGNGNVDIVFLAIKAAAICIDILFIRNGMLLGNKSYLSEMQKLNLPSDEILTAFIMQHYLQNETDDIVPDKILTNIKLPDYCRIEALLHEKFKRKIIIRTHILGVQKHLITMAEANALNALKTHVVAAANYFDLLLNFQQTFDLANLPRCIECFDVSHTMGELQIAACVVFDECGPDKRAYRRFNINTASTGDDYTAMREAMQRRYGDRQNLPNVIIVDGGRGQLNVASQVLQQLQIQNVFLLAVAKGRERKPGLEEIYICNKQDLLVLPPQSLTLQLIQRVRDEAHRFAISGHRKKMIKTRRQSILNNIVGIGKARQIKLLKHFGGLAELKGAGVGDLIKIHGINRNLAQRIYDYLHAE